MSDIIEFAAEIAVLTAFVFTSLIYLCLKYALRMHYS